ncbi:nitrate reductase [candidate division LCP-89 bacterium B3_LCP]|uniref:Chaperone NapD n=1 Tax=candidate division LCP-89 bacterium B3_LCP TaxID=2012998 RepID=A0A532UU83_UNCL8|nr:MAG: nitrate reductase [candidate division LCP-89 bacterium B3_LCP]
MSVSGVIVRTMPEKVSDVIKSLEESGLCDVFFSDATGKIVVTIEGDTTEEEMRKFKEIQNIPDVISVDLAYSHTDDNFNRNGKDTGDIPDFLKD